MSIAKVQDLFPTYATFPTPPPFLITDYLLRNVRYFRKQQQIVHSLEKRSKMYGACRSCGNTIRFSLGYITIQCILISAIEHYCNSSTNSILRHSLFLSCSRSRYCAFSLVCRFKIKDIRILFKICEEACSKSVRTCTKNPGKDFEHRKILRITYAT